MATTTTLLTIDEYLKTSYHPDCDFVDGELEERNLGQFDHSALQAFLAAWFWPRRSEWRIRVLTEQRLRVSSGSVRIPDVCLISVDSPREQVTETPPLLCVEILPPDGRLPRVLTKLDDFAAMGVPNIWIIDPPKRAGYIYTSPDNLKIVTERLTIPETPIYLDLPALFAELD